MEKKEASDVELGTPDEGSRSPELVASNEPDSSSSSSPPSPPLNKRQLSGWRLFVVQLVLCLGLLLSVMESSIVATALVTIGNEFNDFTTATWIVLAYLLSYMGLAIVFSRLSDVIGRKWAVMLSWLIFTAFSLGCGLATNINQLIAFRVLQGVGGSGLYTLTMVVVPEISPPKLFAIMSGSIGAVFAVAGVLGPILGGVITRYSTWRWIFLLNCPFGLLAMFLLLVAWPKGTQSTVVNKVKWTHIDWLGTLLLLAASVLLIFGLQEAGSTAYSWSSATIISTLTIGSLCWVLFALWIIYMHKRRRAGKTEAEAIFPLSVILRGKMAVTIVTTILSGFSFILILIFLPEHFQIVQLNSPIQAGVHILPMLCATAAGSGVAAVLSIKKNLTFYTLIIGSALIVIGCGLLSTAKNSFKIPTREYGYQVIVGFGIGLIFATVTLMCALEARVRDLAVAQGVVNQARILGGTLGLAVATIIFNAEARKSLSSKLTPQELMDLQRAPTSAYSLPLVKQLAVRDVFAKSFNEQLRVCTYVAAACFVVSIFGFSRNPPQVLERKEYHQAVLDGRVQENDE